MQAQLRMIGNRCWFTGVLRLRSPDSWLPGEAQRNPEVQLHGSCAQTLASAFDSVATEPTEPEMNRE
jgi:hypothetical protein